MRRQLPEPNHSIAVPLGYRIGSNLHKTICLIIAQDTLPRTQLQSGNGIWQCHCFKRTIGLSVTNPERLYLSATLALTPVLRNRSNAAEHSCAISLTV
jgi:hypothetical protein